LNWIFDARAKTIDGSSSYVNVTYVYPETDYLVVRGFGFGVPANATLKGLTAKVVRRSTSNQMRDREISLLLDQTPVGENRADPQGSNAWSTTLTTVTYGGDSDLWGFTLTPEMVNAATFGVGFRAKYPNASGSDDAEVDAIMLSVSYCE
jgi:hypothetical protein